MQKYKLIEAALIESKGVVVDDHAENATVTLAGLAALVHGDKVFAVGLHKADYFSLNQVYLASDGKIHLSRNSLAGVLFPVNFDGDLHKCIADYNAKQEGNRFTCGTLENAMTLFPVPVTVVTLINPEWREGITEAMYSSKHFVGILDTEPGPDLMKLLEEGDTAAVKALVPKTL